MLNGTITSFPNIPWPNSLLKALQGFRYIELEVFSIPSLQCIRPKWRLNAIDQFWLSLVITFLVPFLIVICYAISRAYANVTARTQRAYMEKIDACKKQCVRCIILFLFATFPSTSRRIFQILPVGCDKLCLTASGYCTSYLRADYSFKCLSFSSKDKSILYMAYLSLVIPFGFILFLLVSLVHVKRIIPVGSIYKEEGDQPLPIRLDYHETTGQHPIVLRKDESTFQFALKFGYENYQPTCWYWEITEMVRKLLFISILPLLSPFSNIFLGVSIIVAGFFALLHAHKKPIKNFFEHWLQMVSLSVIPANLCIAYILDTMASQHFSIFDEREEKLGIGVILILLNSTVILIVTLSCIRGLIRKVTQLWRQHQCSCKGCIACILPRVSQFN